MNAFLLLVALAPQAGAEKPGFPGLPANHRPEVEIPWNRFYDAEEIYGLLDRLEARWPELLAHEVIGHSVQNRELRVYTLCDRTTGEAATKPAMWVDGNVHGNEVQGAEAVVYLAWYLLENRESSERARALLDESAFYLLPMVNPDGRARWFADAASASSSRSGVQPLDRDGDGRFDEDGPNDLDGDGNIVQMRKHVPGEGTHRLDPDDPRVMVSVPPNDKGIRGDWIFLGQEGLDDDGDGRINEDDVGGYDMNRSWPSLWQPDHVQFGAGPYPLYWPETRAIARFLLEHSNVAGVQSFHNNGGMILRGPGAEVFGEYPRQDVAVYDELGKDGEAMLPFYRYMIIWRDLYSVFGGFVNWTYEGLGILSFTNELWADEQISPDKRLGQGMKDQLLADDRLLLGEGFVDWHPFEHPLYGTVEIGGFQKDVGRVPPTFLVEEMIHRNALFCVRHAEAMPKVAIREPVVTDLGGAWAVDVVFANEHLIPTRSAQAAKQKIGRPDRLVLEGPEIRVLAGGVRSDRFRPERIELQEHDPAHLVLEEGIGSREELRVRWLVTGSGTATLRFEGEKARVVERTLEMP
jgi:hypothetical protein